MTKSQPLEITVEGVKILHDAISRTVSNESAAAAPVVQWQSFGCETCDFTGVRAVSEKLPFTSNTSPCLLCITKVPT